MSTKIATLVFHTDLDTESRYINNGTLLSTFVHGYGNFYLNFGELKKLTIIIKQRIFIYIN